MNNTLGIYRIPILGGDVDEVKGEFTVIYNAENYVGELAGRPLYFEVTVTKILKA